MLTRVTAFSAIQALENVPMNVTKNHFFLAGFFGFLRALILAAKAFWSFFMAAVFTRSSILM
jgi:hypothetical protein